MPPLRAFITLCSSFILVAGLLFIGLSADSTRYAEEGHSSNTVAGRFKSLFSFRTPDSLFTPAATISLTDDNTTFFAARPAAFGPPLPSHGLSGQIWIGAGFGDDNHRRRGLATSIEGELGCSDIPGWADSDWSPVAHGTGRASGMTQSDAASDQGSEDGLMLGGLQHSTIEDGTDDHFHYPLSHTSIAKSSAESIEDGYHLRHPYMHGRVALLSRGGCGFSEKIQWAQRRGASAVIVGDSQRGGPLVRMYARSTVNITIPSLFTSHMTAHLLSSLVPNEYSTARGKYRRPARSERIARTDGSPSRFPAAVHGIGKSQLAPAEEATDVMTTGLHVPTSDEYQPEYHDGLWVTLLMADMTISPFFNTLFVLVVSPLITLAIVYIMLLVRARIRRRRWRAPKSIVERLPVRIYRAISSRTSSSGADTPRPPTYTLTTPLLFDNQSGSSAIAANGGGLVGPSTPSSSTQYGSLESDISVREKPTSGRDAWHRRHGTRQVECSVCLEEYEDGVSKVMSLPCGHDFHVDCMYVKNPSL